MQTNLLSCSEPTLQIYVIVAMTGNLLVDQQKYLTN